MSERISSLRRAWVFGARALLPQRRRWLGLVISVALGVAGIVSVEGALEAARQSLYQTAQELLGADLKISSWRPLEGDEWMSATRTRLKSRGVVVSAVELASMARPISEARAYPPILVSLKGVSAGYPLRGALRVSALTPSGQRDPPQARSAAELKQDEVWIAPLLWERLQRQARERQAADVQLQLGVRRFRVAGVIQGEPDAGLGGALSFAPRVLIRESSLRDLNLIQVGSRARRSLLFALDPRLDTEDGSSPKLTARQAIKSLAGDLKRDAPLHVRVQSFGDAQPNTVQLLERVALFFLMISLVALCLCLTALISGSWGLISDLIPLSATARAIGLSARDLARAYTGLFVLIGALGAGAGLGLGWLIQWGLSVQLAPLLKTDLTPLISLELTLKSLGLGVGMCLMVNTLTQRGLKRMSAQELKSDASAKLSVHKRELALAGILSLALIGAEVWSSSGSLALGIGFAVALLTLLALTATVVSLLLMSLQLTLKLSAGLTLPAGMRFALRQLLGDRASARVSLTALGVSGALIGGLVLVDHSLQRALTLDVDRAPQLFLIDIQSDQRDVVNETFRELNLPAPQLRSLIRARITALRGERITRDELSAERPAGQSRARALRREYNLTTQVKLTATEEITRGRWWSEGEAQSPAERLVSVERRHARRLGIRVGDEVTFDLQGREMSFQVQSLRAVNWLSFQPNFLYALAPGAVQGAPRSWVGSARLRRAEDLSALSELLFERAPNVSVLDLRPALAEGRVLLDTLSSALSLTGLVCVIAGLLSLLGSLRRERARRARGVSLLSSLGVSQRRARLWVIYELALLGGLGALTCLFGMWGCGWAATQALNIPLSPHPMLTLIVFSIGLCLPPFASITTSRSR